jgi:hypothetical protein
VLAAHTLPLVASLLIGGVVADRMSRRTVMLAADVSRLATQGVLGAPGHRVLRAGVDGPDAGGGARAAAAGQRLRATAMAGGEIAGPVLATRWRSTLPRSASARGCSPGYDCGVGGWIPREASTFIADLKDGWGAFRSRTWVWSIVASASLGNVLWGSWSSLGPVVAAADPGGAAVWGGAMGVGAFAGAVAGIRVRPRRRWWRPAHCWQGAA